MRKITTTSSTRNFYTPFDEKTTWSSLIRRKDKIMFEAIKADIRRRINEKRELIVHLSMYENREDQIDRLQHEVDTLIYELGKYE